jgi:predicted transposase YbfD/YdcC
MGDTTTDCAAFDEAVVFLSHFKDLKDPRQQGKVTYPLDEILLLCLLAVLAGAETVVDIALFGCKKRELLRRFRRFKDGTPAHDRGRSLLRPDLGDILAVLDAEQFQSCFVAWVGALTGVVQGVIAIDGKTSRRSGRKTGGNPPIHMVSAFAARREPSAHGLDPWGLVLGQVKVAEKSNEIIAIPKLRANACSPALNMLAIEGAIVTIDAPMGDAMGCQREIAQKVIDKKADYVLALKANQGSARARMLRASWPSRRRQASKTPRSARTRRLTAITAASKPEPPPSSTMSPGCKNVTTGPASTPWSWSRAPARSPERSSRRHAATSPRWCSSHT